MVELGIATAVVVAVMVLAIQSMVMVARRMDISRQDLIVSQTASSMLERVTARPFDDIDELLLNADDLQRLAGLLPSGWTVKLAVVDEDEPLRAKRITLALVQHDGQPGVRRQSITTWRFGTEELPE